MRPLLAVLSVLAAASLLACDNPARVELSPASMHFFGRSQSLKVHATPISKNGKAMPDQICKWSSSDDKVATVSGPHNEATVTSAGPGSAAIRCALEGGVVAELPISVRMVTRVAAGPGKMELKMLDDPQPVALEVQAFDDTGALVTGRPPITRCAKEDVCRGDQRGQLWAVGPGDTTASVEVDGVRSPGEIAVHVVDARTELTKPKRVTGNPMLEVEKAVRERDAAEAKKKAKP